MAPIANSFVMAFIQGQAGSSGRGVVADHEQENGTHARIKHRRTLDSDGMGHICAHLEEMNSTFYITLTNHHSTQRYLEVEQVRKKLKDAQFELSTTRTELELKIITLEQAVRTSEIEREKLATRADELQSQRRFLFEKEKKTSAKNHELEEQLNEYKVNHSCPRKPISNGRDLPCLLTVIGILCS